MADAYKKRATERHTVPIFRLDPLHLDDERWKASSIVEPVWVVASTAARARQLVAEKVFVSVKPATAAPELPSPWLWDSLTCCALEQRNTDIAIGTVMLADQCPFVSGKGAPRDQRAHR